MGDICGSDGMGSKFGVIDFRKGRRGKAFKIIERVSDSEIYLLDENKVRKRRICGQQREDKTPGLLCLKRAGWGTVHLGAGRCKFHGGNDEVLVVENKVEFIDRLVREARFRTVTDIEVVKKVFEEGDYKTVSAELQILSVLVIRVLRRILDEVQSDEQRLKDERFLKDLIRDIAAIKKIKQELSQVNKVDIESVRTIFNIFFASLRARAGDAALELVKQDLGGVLTKKANLAVGDIVSAQIVS